RGYDPDKRRYRWIRDLPLEAHKNKKVPILAWANVVYGPASGALQALDINGDCIARGAHHRDINGLLVAQGQVRVRAEPVQHREDVELSGKVRVVCGHKV